MHKIVISVVLSLLLVFTYCLEAFGQYPLYGVKNIGSDFEFIGIDLSQDSIVSYGPIPVNYFSSTFSSTFDPINQKYYYCTGQKIFVIDPNTGISIDTLNFTSIHPYFLYNIVFNEMDGNIYGIKQNVATLRNEFAKFNPLSGTFVNSIFIPGLLKVGSFSKSTIDLDRQEYILQSTSVSSIDIATGGIRYSFPIDSNSFNTFNHIDFNCKNNFLYGLRNDPNSQTNYLAIFDTLSGSITDINPTPLPVNFYNQNESGSCIDKVSDIFYYASFNGFLYGIDIHTGNVVYSHNYGPGIEFLFLQCSSQFQCPLSNIETLQNESIRIYPNPVASQLFVDSKNQTIDKILVKEITGKEICNFSSTNSSPLCLNVSHISSGMYVIIFFDKDGTLLFKSKFIKF